jgi:alkyl hydroperoxide reductase subunit AhpC
LAPDFIAVTREGTLSLERWQAGSWVVLLSQPRATSDARRDFTAHANSFEAADVKVLALTLAEPEGPAEAPVGRIDSSTARALGLIGKAAGKLRPALIVLDPMRAVRVALYYPPGVDAAALGTLRLVEALREGDAWIAARFRTHTPDYASDRESRVDGQRGAGEDPLSDETPFGFSRPVIA